MIMNDFIAGLMVISIFASILASIAVFCFIANAKRNDASIVRE